MRLNVEQIQDIVRQAHAIAGREATVWLFGSRLDDRRSGGDVDLLIESTPSIGLMQRAQLKMALERRLQLPVDIIAADPSTQRSAFVQLARAQATRLCGAPT